MTSKTLNCIEFKNRPWLLLIIIPFAFFLFIVTYVLYFLLRDHEEKFWFYITSLIFILELRFFIQFFSKFRYVPSGKLQFDDDGIKFTGGKSDFTINWEQIESYRQFYRGDFYWKFKIGKYTFRTGKARYRNLKWNFRKILDEQQLDCFDINSKRYYVKISNENDKQLFMDMFLLAESKVGNAKLIKTP